MKYIIVILILLFTQITLGTERYEEQYYFGFHIGHSNSSKQSSLPFGFNLDFNNPWIEGLLIGWDLKYFKYNLDNISSSEIYLTHSSISLKYFVLRIPDNGVFLYGTKGWTTGDAIYFKNGEYIHVGGTSHSLGIGYSYPISSETSVYSQIGILQQKFNSILDDHIESSLITFQIGMSL